MNILIGAKYAAPCSGNFIGSLLDLGNYLRKHGHSVCYAFPKCENTLNPDGWAKWLEKSGYPVYLVDDSASEEEQLSVLKEIIQKEKIELVHSHFWLFHSVIVNHRKELPVKILLHEHMERPTWMKPTKYWWKRIRRSAMYRRKRISIICVNKKVAHCHALAQHWYLTNGLSEHRNVQNILSREAYREKLGLLPDEKIVLFMGHDPVRKGLDIAVRAVKKLRKEGMTVRLGLLGFGKVPSGPRAELYEKFIKDEEDAEAVLNLENEEDMYAVHRAADCYLSSSRSEAFSYGLIEAISQNTPIVVSNIKGTRWSLAFNNSYEYSVEDSDACADAIRQALEKGRVESNFREMVDLYGIDRWCEQILKIYHKVK